MQIKLSKKKKKNEAKNLNKEKFPQKKKITH